MIDIQVMARKELEDEKTKKAIEYMKEILGDVERAKKDLASAQKRYDDTLTTLELLDSMDADALLEHQKLNGGFAVGSPGGSITRVVWSH